MNRALAAALALLAANAVRAAEPATRKADASTPTGIWRIETRPPANAVKLCAGYLPDGTRVGLHAPSHRLGLMAPLSSALCTLPLGEPFAAGTNLCTDGALAVDPNQPYTFVDAYFTTTVQTATDVRERAYPLQMQHGAVVGSPFVYVFLRQRVGDWNLFLQSHETMVSNCDATLPNGETLTFPMVWHRQPGR